MRPNENPRDQATPMARRLHVVWQGSAGMALLLAVLLVVVFVVPAVFVGERLERVFVDGTLTLLLVGGALTLPESRGAAVALGACAATALAIRWLPWALPDASMPLLREVSVMVTFLLFAGLVGAKVFAPGRVTLNRVFAAVNLYLFLGLTWAMAYEALAMVHPGSFTSAPSLPPEGHVRWVYFSFVTLTTVGFGDITPLAPVARSLTVLEALVGQLYPVVLLGRLVSLEAGDATPGSR